MNNNERREENSSGDDGRGGREGVPTGGVGCGGGSCSASVTEQPADKICDNVSQNSTKRRADERDEPGVSGGTNSDDGSGGRPAKRIRELPTWLNGTSEGVDKILYESFKKRSVRVYEELQKSDGELIRDVYRFENDAEYENFISIIQRDVYYQRGLLQVCREVSHCHVIHDCSYHGGTCRCNWFKKVKSFGLHHRRDKRGCRRNSSRTRDLSDVFRFMLYYAKEERSTVYQRIGGKTMRLPSQGYNIPKERSDGMYECIREMEVQVAGDGTELRSLDDDPFTDEPDQRVAVKKPARQRRKISPQEALQLQVVQILKENPMCPPEAIVSTKVWRDNSELRFRPPNDRIVAPAIADYKNELLGWSMKDYQEMYKQPKCRPIFSAGYLAYDSCYYNTENSVNILRELVAFQCGYDEDAINNFVGTLYAVLERTQPKLNCIIVQSPSSAGKNFFFDCIRAYYLNCGKLCIAAKGNNFPFQDAHCRRLVFWNEPNYSPEFTEPIKELLGGDATSVHVKMVADSPVFRTPVIVTTNNWVGFMTDPVFKDRCRIFCWETAPFLKEYSKKPNP